MIDTQKRVATVITASLLIAVFTGCSNPMQTLSENVVEQAVEAGTGSDIDVDLGGGAELPEGWPSDVKVIEGFIITTASAGDSGARTMTAIIEVTDSVLAFSQAKEQLLSAGFSQQSETSSAAGEFGLFQKGSLSVSILSGPSSVSEGNAITYIVNEGG